MDEKNGAPIAHEVVAEERDLPALPPEPAQAPRPQTVTPMTPAQAVEAAVLQVVGAMVRGIIVSAPGVPNGFVMQKIAATTGMTLEVLLSGNPLEATVKARAEFRKAFDDGMAKVPVLQAPMSGVGAMPQAGPNLRR